MATIKEIKNRIRSVQDTKKITNAMYLISSTKVRKAKSDLEKTKPYFVALKREIDRVFSTAPGTQSKYFYPEGDIRPVDGPDAVLVVTADKGLAGAYNSSVLHLAEKHMESNPQTRLFVVGEYGRQYFMHKNVQIEKSFLYTAQNPTMHRAREIAAALLELFENEEVDNIYVIYTDMKNSFTEEAVEMELLPFHRYGSDKLTAIYGEIPEEYHHFTSNGDHPAFEWVPSVDAVLKSVIQSYLSGFVYGALIDSFCAEQNARMTAMSSANDNAEEILNELSIQYNRVRQAGITQEITEVSSGAKAQRRKRNKEAGVK